jgi:hypothetical protein
MTHAWAWGGSADNGVSSLGALGQPAAQQRRKRGLYQRNPLVDLQAPEGVVSSGLLVYHPGKGLRARGRGRKAAARRRVRRLTERCARSHVRGADIAARWGSGRAGRAGWRVDGHVVGRSGPGGGWRARRAGAGLWSSAHTASEPPLPCVQLTRMKPCGRARVDLKALVRWGAVLRPGRKSALLPTGLTPAQCGAGARQAASGGQGSSAGQGRHSRGSAQLSTPGRSAAREH